MNKFISHALSREGQVLAAAKKLPKIKKAPKTEPKFLIKKIIFSSCACFFSVAFYVCASQFLSAFFSYHSA
jgi:hypothetical protein